MKDVFKFRGLLILVMGGLAAVSCRSKASGGSAGAEVSVATGEREEMTAFSGDTRQLYNNRKFAELEKLADELRASKAKFRRGTWKISLFYDSLDCRRDEPESMFQLHEQIYQDWEKAFPKSITARVSHAQFMTDYAWHARGSGYAKDVTEEGWRLFRERLAVARTILDQSQALAPCPVWWQVRMKVGLGQGEENAECEKVFQQAKALEPLFFEYDISRAYHLLPRWHGEPGDWEAAAEKEIERPGGLGHEGYARVVLEQNGFYDNVFKQSKASWRNTRKGFDEMRSRYPDSKELLNAYCRMACLAGDREQAKALFAEIGAEKYKGAWRKGEFEKARQWAEGTH